MKVTQQEREVIKEVSKILPKLQDYQRGYLIGLITAYSKQSKQAAGNE